jgi:RNA polymerase sigma-70 factor (ECF subfamily)
VRALLAGDERTFAGLVDGWSPAMLHVARLHVATPEAAEDVVQDAWLAVLQGIARFEGRSSLRTWVFAILTNLARTRGVKDNRQVPVADPTELPLGPSVDPARFYPRGEPGAGAWRQPPQPWPTPEDEILGSEIRTVIKGCLGRLPERQRSVIELRDVLGYNAPEVCAILDVTDGNQRILLHRARATVRTEIERYLGQRLAAGRFPSKDAP